jgi:hypothetical protein
MGLWGELKTRFAMSRRAFTMHKLAKEFGDVFMRLCTPACVLLLLISPPAAGDPFSFAVTADMRGLAGTGYYNDTPRYFRGVCEAIAAVGPGAFMVSPGDIDQPAGVKWTIEQHIDSAYIWYPVVGNHELPGAGQEFYLGSNMDWLREYNAGGNSLPHIVNAGPPGCRETTYSFDYQNAHFVVLNEYYDGTSDAAIDGDVVDALYDWLAEDLASTLKPHIFVFGHEPAYPQPDADNGRQRHIGDSLDKYPARRDRFWRLLRDRGVVAYICGHTHNYSAVNKDGVWQVDVAHARGAGDTGAPSTFLMVNVVGDDLEDVTFHVYRDIHDGDYDYDDIQYTWDASLPMVISSFSARREGDAVALEWIVKGGVVLRGFIVERRPEDTDSWNAIASYLTHVELMAQEGASFSRRYEYIDDTVQSDCAYVYRLAVVSDEGTTEYLGMVKLH